MIEYTATVECDVRVIQPYEAHKGYVCPGCNRDIPPRTRHIVAVPVEAPDMRRHWHIGCWERRLTHHPRR